jgi:P4 family phage/plasmid primase-like protien
MPAHPPQEPEAAFSEADLCDRYLATHQRTLFAEGRFWRCPNPQRPWQPVEDSAIARELLFVFQSNQGPGLRPTARRIDSLLEFLRRRLDELLPEAWDDPAGYFPFATRLHTASRLEEVPYTPDHCVATTLPYDYLYGATAPAWEAFLASTIPHAADFLQEFAGYCLLDDNRHELSLWLFGPPRSGKATCLLGLQTLLGPFAGTLSLPQVSSRRLDPAFLRRKRLLICHEPPFDHATAGFFNSLVSGEPLTLDRPYRAPLTVRSTARLALSFHALPPASPSLRSLYHRAALVHFPGLAHGQHDPFLKDRIAQEGPGLFNWAVAGLRRLRQRGRFDPPSTLIAAAQVLQLPSAGVTAFIEDCCLRDPVSRVQARVLYDAYLAWCRSRGVQSPLTIKAIPAEWKRHGFKRLREHNISYWQGVSLLQLPAASRPVRLASPASPGPHAPAEI